jgi:transketolase
MSWLKLLGDKGRFVGMHGFGASGPAEQLYEHLALRRRPLLKRSAAQL